MSPSVLSHNEILRTVSLYYLTKTFISSIYEYAQNPDAFKSVYAKVPTDAPFLFTDFHYNIWFWPEDLVAKVGNLVYFKCKCRAVLSDAPYSYLRSYSNNPFRSVSVNLGQLCHWMFQAAFILN